MHSSCKGNVVLVLVEVVVLEVVVEVLLVVLDGGVNKTEQSANPDLTLPSKIPLLSEHLDKSAQAWLKGQASEEYQVYQEQSTYFAQKS